ncbi:MAG: VCBS repeat-containing protein [Bacteroidota bacterium]|nr:VCBS repeat-containing protein [Bacteroidota bacterium]
MTGTFLRRGFLLFSHLLRIRGRAKKLFSLSALLLLAVSALNAQWTTVGTAGFSAGSVVGMSLAFDGSTPYVAYGDYNKGLYATVMKFDGTNWVTVGAAGFSAGSVEEHISLAFDGSTPYVAYHDGGNGGKATVMKFDGTKWVTVGLAGFSAGEAEFTSLAFDGSTPYVAYDDVYDINKATVMKFDGTKWVTVGTANFSAGPAYYLSFAFDDSTPYVAFSDGGNSNNGFKATVMKFDGTKWVTVGSAEFSAGEADFTSLAFDGSTPYVAYEDGGNSNKATVMKFDGTSWDTVGTAGFSAGQANYTSLAFDGSTPYVAYEDFANSNKATVMKFDGTNWVTVGTAGFSVGQTNYTSLAFDGSTPYVAYEDYTNGNKATVMKFTPLTTVTSVSPSKNALNVAATTAIHLTFSADMDSTTLIANRTIKVNGSFGGLDSGSISYNSGTKTATYTPMRVFKPGEVVTVAATTGIKAKSGNALSPYSWSFTVHSGAADTYAPKVDYTVAHYPTYVAAADLDGDGNIDFVVGNTSSDVSVISVFKNNGDGTFAPKADYATGVTPRAVTAADVDGDGHIDLVVTNGSSNTVSVLKNKGDGTFAAKVDYAAGTEPTSVTAADLDGDGYIDLAVANYSSSTLSVFKNNGDGTFAARVDYATGAGPHSVAAADLDGDGYVDLVVVNQNANTVSVFKNKGDGTFAAKVDYTTGGTPQWVTAGDLDGDGHIDLAVANANSNTVSVFKNKGDGTFAAKVDYTTGSNTFPSSVTAADLDGDGDLDLAAANSGSNTVSVLKNNGDGTFASKVDYTTGLSPYAVAAADLNGDGAMGLLVTNESSASVSVLTSVVLPKITSVTPSKNALNVAASASIQFTFNKDMDSTTLIAGSTIKVRGSLTGLHSGTISYDSSTRTATYTPASAFKPGEVVTVTATTGIKAKSGKALNSPYSWSFTVQSGSADTYLAKADYTTGKHPGSVAAADLDGDGNIDLVVANSDTLTNTVSVFKNNGDGTFAAKADYATGKGPVSVAAADLNGDGHIDLVVADQNANTISVLKNNGDGTFAAKVDYTAGTHPISVSVADVDGDGDLDIAVVNWNSNTLSVFKNNGDGTFAAKVDYATGTYPTSVTAADVDGDGNLDLIVANLSSNTVSVFKNNGDGTFAAKVDYTTGTSPVSVTAADLDGDGKIDLAVANLYSNTVSVFKNNGDGTFAAKVDYATGSNTFPSSVTAADLNGDGAMDLAVADYSNTVSVFKNNGDGTFAAKVDYKTGSHPSPVIAADLNGDGAMDLAVTNFSSNTVSVILSHKRVPTYSDGTLDGGFGIGGEAAAAFGADNTVNAIAIQPDGKIVAAGGSNADFALARFTAKGVLDTTFGTKGKVTTDLGSVMGPEQAYGVAIQRDGKIVAAGLKDQDFALARYDSNGTLDASFGTGGKVVTDVGNSSDDGGKAVAIQSNGKIVVAGYSNNNFAVLRYDTTGSLDASFGTGGKVTTDFGGFEYGYGIAIQTDGKIVVAGDAGPGFAVARYDTNGSLDAAFGTNGKVKTTFGGSLFEYATSVALLSDGKIVVTGTTDNGANGGDVVVVCYNTDGSLYTGFNSTGSVKTDFGGDDYGNALAIQHDGRIVVVGSSGTQLLVARYNTDGSLDNTFNSTGKKLVTWTTNATGSAVALQPDYKIVIAASIATTQGTQMGVMRLTDKTDIWDAVKSLQSVPKTYTLAQNYPNPFNPTTTILYELPKQSHVVLEVYDILGRRVETLVDEEKPAGEYSVVFNGGSLASGVYIYRMRADNFTSVKKLLLVK